VSVCISTSAYISVCLHYCSVTFTFLYQATDLFNVFLFFLFFLKKQSRLADGTVGQSRRLLGTYFCLYACFICMLYVYDGGCWVRIFAYVCALYVCLLCMTAAAGCIFLLTCMSWMYALYLCRVCMYALYVCLICMPYMYALYVCLICMPYMYASLVLNSN